MSNTPHTLHDEFPDHAQKLSALKNSSAHFAQLLVDYDAVNAKIHRSETRLDLLTDEEEEALRRQRVHLKDHIWAHLKEA
ncbi:YdcH family protein [Tabrizicola sp. BL-A-41-H6]|uniref:YdcH family protein n=1 Tax=Tabrizicola sp. BL-A-41-H6 TaxID=3421107 RepID=UPI003D670D8F